MAHNGLRGAGRRENAQHLGRVEDTTAADGDNHVDAVVQEPLSEREHLRQLGVRANPIAHPGLAAQE